MTDARCERCTEKRVGISDIIHAGHGDRYQVFSFSLYFLYFIWLSRWVHILYFSGCHIGPFHFDCTIYRYSVFKIIYFHKWIKSSANFGIAGNVFNYESSNLPLNTCLVGAFVGFQIYSFPCTCFQISLEVLDCANLLLFTAFVHWFVRGSCSKHYSLYIILIISSDLSTQENTSVSDFESILVNFYNAGIGKA